MSTAATPDYHTAIVGAGFSGIGAAIKFDEAGLGPYVIIEAGDGPGGTWYWNRYPGVAVDIPSFSYQFSFEQRPDWSRTYAHGDELRSYAELLADKYGVRSKIRFNTEVIDATWDEEHGFWRLTLDSGDAVTARFLVNAAGVLTTPKLPDIAGVDGFDGVTIHTARWDHSQDLTGKRVAIIGTGASAVQVIPEIAPIVEHLTVYQRTPIWCFPKFDVPLPKAARWAMQVPGGRPSTARLEPDVRRADVPALGAVLRHVAARDGVPRRGKSVPAQGSSGSCAAGETHAPLRRGLQAAGLSQHLPVDLQP